MSFSGQVDELTMEQGPERCPEHSLPRSLVNWSTCQLTYNVNQS